MNRDIRRSIERATDRAHGVIEDVKDRLVDLSDAATSEGKSMLRAGKSYGDRLLEEAQNRGEDVWEDTVRWVRKNPGLAIGAAVAAVALLVLFNRSDE